MTTAASVGLMVMGTTSNASQTTHQIDVPAQSLNAAINELSLETGQPIVGDQRLMAGKVSKAVKGNLTTHEALAAMVAGSGLHVLELPDRSFALQEVASSQDGDFLLDQVVIEGERSGRTLKDTPASVTVLSGEEADQAQNLDTTAVVDEVPNVIFEAGNSLAPVVRGIDGSAGIFGATAFTTGAQPRVNVIVDGVARPLNVSGSIPTISSLWDTEQVEVARGPQSTLGGRNSLAGNIRIQTKDPIHEFEGSLRGFGYTEQGTFGGAGMLNVPIVKDQLALRVTAEASDGESFIDFTSPAAADMTEFLEDEEMRRYRAKLLITPDAIRDLEVVATFERIESFKSFLQEADEGLFVNSGFPVGPAETTQDVFSAEARYNLTENITFEARGSYLENRLDFVSVSPISFASDDFDTTTISAEGLVRFEDISVVNRAVFGVTYERQEESATATNPAPFLPDFILDGEIENIGIFGEVEFGLTDRLALIAGGRVEIDDRSRAFASSFGAPEILDVSETAFLPKVGLRYEVTEDVSVGYQYSVGFRPGGLDFDVFDPSAGSTIFDSERLRQHELYTRSSFLGGRATLNASAFFYTFEDAQVAGAGGLTINGIALFGNVPDARGFGGEVEGSFEIVNGLVASGGIGLLETEITDAGPVLAAFEGSELERTSNVTFNFGLTYVSDLGFDASARVRHIGEVDTVFLGGEPVPSYTVVDLNAGYEYKIDDKRTFRLEGFVNNVTDERIILQRFFGEELLGRPRTFGIGGTLKF
ncbi:MAG: TonB-dependent receptor [Pseudomonadota bacterium]